MQIAHSVLRTRIVQSACRPHLAYTCNRRAVHDVMESLQQDSAVTLHLSILRTRPQAKSPSLKSPCNRPASLEPQIIHARRLMLVALLATELVAVASSWRCLLPDGALFQSMHPSRSHLGRGCTVTEASTAAGIRGWSLETEMYRSTLWWDVLLRAGCWSDNVLSFAAGGPWAVCTSCLCTLLGTGLQLQAHQSFQGDWSGQSM